MQTKVKLVKRIEPNGVASGVSVRMIHVRQTENSGPRESEDRILQRGEVLVTRELDALDRKSVV